MDKDCKFSKNDKAKLKIQRSNTSHIKQHAANSCHTNHFKYAQVNQNKARHNSKQKWQYTSIPCLLVLGVWILCF